MGSIQDFGPGHNFHSLGFSLTSNHSYQELQELLKLSNAMVKQLTHSTLLSYRTILIILFQPAMSATQHKLLLWDQLTPPYRGCRISTDDLQHCQVVEIALTSVVCHCLNCLPNYLLVQSYITIIEHNAGDVIFLWSASNRC